MRDLDTFDLLPESIDHDRVAAEQFPTLEVVALESFSGAAHRAMLLHHEWQLAAFRQRQSPVDKRLGPDRLRLATEEVRGFEQRRQLQEQRDRSLNTIADQAYENRRSA